MKNWLRRLLGLPPKPKEEDSSRLKEPEPFSPSAPPKEPEPSSPPCPTLYCPQCGGIVRAKARYCAHSGASSTAEELEPFSPVPPPKEPEPSSPAPAPTLYCPQCGGIVPAKARYCDHSGAKITLLLHDAPTQPLPPFQGPLPPPFPLSEEEQLLQIIEQAAQDGRTMLNLSNRRLSKLPPEIGRLTNLTRLILNNNSLTTLPKEIGQLQHLKELSVRRNGTLLKVPDELWSIKSLEKLGVGGNKISTISKEIKNLTNLTELSLWGNSFTSIPLEVFTLKKLRLLNLSHLRLEILPKEVGNLTNLEVLSAADNNLRQLPREIKNLTKLKELWLYNNPLTIPPEILDRIDEPATILNYYFREQKTPLNEAKLMLVGQGEVGKTSLVRRLIEDKFDEHEAITEGININQWAVGMR